jgi:hypothetical protein
MGEADTEMERDLRRFNDIRVAMIVAVDAVDMKNQTGDISGGCD